MHKAFGQIKKVLPVFTALALFPLILVAQEGFIHERIADIQYKYELGTIDLEYAVSKQYHLIFETAEMLHDHPQEKCLTPAFMFLHEHKNKLSAKEQATLENERAAKLSANRNQSEQRYTSPSGKFEIIYYTSGTDSVSIVDENENGIPDYIDRVAEAADSSYRHQVINIGFTDPIPEGQTYKVFVEDNLPGGAYGYTTPSSDYPGGTYIVIESDFNNFPKNDHPEGNQIGAIYATMAHEFKHSIQYVQNNWRSPSGGFNWSEMDATLMEEVVYDNVNDYYNYIKTNFDSDKPNSSSIFIDPRRGTPGAYYHVSWMIFYSEYFGNDLWQEVWQEIEQENDLSIDNALRRLLPNRGTDFAQSFVLNHLWHYASGPRQGTDSFGFDEKSFYPYANVEDTLSGLPAVGIEISSIQELAAEYYEVIPSLSDEGFVNIAVDFDTSQVGLGMILYMKNGEMLDFYDTGENKPQVYIPTEVRWQDVEKMGVVITNHSNTTYTRDLKLHFGTVNNPVTIKDPKYQNIPDAFNVYQNYPNPFNPSTNIRFDLTNTSDVELSIFDITGRKVQTLANKIFQAGEHTLTFDGSGLSSGVYLYRLRINDQVYTKKMLLIK